MDRYQIRLRALHLLSLIATLQVPATWSYPFGVTNQDTNKALDPDCPPEPPPAVPYVSSSSVYEYISQQEYTGYDWQPTAWGAGNGQVQAAYTISTEVVAVATSGSMILSWSIITSYYTPLPRQDTMTPTSTSTTTVFVLPSPSPTPLITNSVPTPSQRATASAASDTPYPIPATNLPDNSLTSLTTSEVQTLTDAPITNTSGVSRF